MSSESSKNPGIPSRRDALVRTPDKISSEFGKRLYSQSKLKESIEHFAEAHRACPENDEYTTNLSNVYNEYGIQLYTEAKFEEGIKYITMACELPMACELRPDQYSHNLAVFHTRYANELRKTSNFPESIKHYTEAYNLFPADTTYIQNLSIAHYNYAMHFLDSHDFQASIQHFTKVQKLCHDMPGFLVNTFVEFTENLAGAHINYALLLGKERKFSESLLHHSKACDLLPEDSRCKAKLADTMAYMSLIYNQEKSRFLKDAQYDKAIEFIEIMVKVNPKTPIYKADLADAHFQYGNSLQRTGMLEGAIAQLEIASGLFTRKKQYADALARARKTLKDSIAKLEEPKAQVIEASESTLSTKQQKALKKKEKKALTQKAAQASGSDDKIPDETNSEEASSEEPEASSSEVTTHEIKAIPTILTEAAMGQNHFNESKKYLANQDYKNAMEEIQKALLIDPNNHVYNNWVGNLYYEQNDHASAIIFFKKALAGKSDSAIYNNNLAHAYYYNNNKQSGDNPKAKKYYKKAAALADSKHFQKFNEDYADMLYESYPHSYAVMFIALIAYHKAKNDSKKDKILSTFKDEKSLYLNLENYSLSEEDLTILVQMLQSYYPLTNTLDPGYPHVISLKLGKNQHNTTIAKYIAEISDNAQALHKLYILKLSESTNNATSITKIDDHTQEFHKSYKEPEENTDGISKILNLGQDLDADLVDALRDGRISQEGLRKALDVGIDLGVDGKKLKDFAILKGIQPSKIIFDKGSKTFVLSKDHAARYKEIISTKLYNFDLINALEEFFTNSQMKIGDIAYIFDLASDLRLNMESITKNDESGECSLQYARDLVEVKYNETGGYSIKNHAALMQILTNKLSRTDKFEIIKKCNDARLFDLIIPVAKTILEQNPKDHEALYYLANAHLGLGQYIEAEELSVEAKTLTAPKASEPIAAKETASQSTKAYKKDEKRKAITPPPEAKASPASSSSDANNSDEEEIIVKTKKISNISKQFNGITLLEAEFQELCNIIIPLNEVEQNLREDKIYYYDQIDNAEFEISEEKWEEMLQEVCWIALPMEGWEKNLTEDIQPSKPILKKQKPIVGDRCDINELINQIKQKHDEFKFYEQKASLGATIKPSTMPPPQKSYKKPTEVENEGVITYTISWQIGGKTYQPGKYIVQVTGLGHDNCYAAITEETLSGLEDAKIQTKFKQACSKSAAKENEQGIKLIPGDNENLFELKVLGFCGDYRLFANKTFRGSNDEMLIIFGRHTKHTGIAKAMSRGFMDVPYNSPEASSYEFDLADLTVDVTGADMS